MKNRPLGGKVGRKHALRPGESSSSNPTTTIHRDAIRAYRKKHATNLAYNTSSRLMNTDSNKEVAEVEAADGQLLVTPAGVFIGLHPQPLPLQKCINAALESSSDVLRERLPEDFADSFCAYFAALFPLVESARELAGSLAKCGDEEVRLKKLLQITGIVYPISAVTRHVPAAVLQRHWSTLTKAVHEMLPVAQLVVSEKSHHDSDSEDEEPENNIVETAGVLLLRSLLSMLSRLLYVRATSMASTSKAEPEDWRPPSGISANLFAALFHFVFHPKPRVRRIAHAAMVRIVSDSSSALCSGVVAKQAADLLFGATKRASNGSESNEVVLRRCLALIRDIAPNLPPTTIKPMAELLLTFTILGSQTVRLLAYGALAACCANDADSAKEESITSSVSLAESLAAALMSDFRPPSITSSANIPHALTSVYCEWLRCVQVAHMAVLRCNPVKALLALPRLIEAIFNIFTATTSSLQAAFTAQGEDFASNERKKLAALAADLLQTWIGVLAQLSRKFKQSTAEFAAVTAAVQSITSILESSLGFEHHQSWPQIMHFISHVINQLGATLPAVETMVKNLLPSLSELQFNASNRLASVPEASIKLLLSAIDEVFGAVIGAIGPELVVSTVPLLEFSPETLAHLRKSDVDAASWLLSLLSRFAGNTASEGPTGSRLPYFIKKLLPLQTLLAKAMSPNNGEGSSTYLSLLYSRVWSTLPAFCATCSSSSPIVVPPDFAKLLGDRLTNDALVRPFVLNALRRLVENAPLQISRYAKNFLPILFNLHVNQAEQQDFNSSVAEDDGLVLQTVRLWLTHADAITLELAQHFLDRTWTRLSDALAKLKSAVSGNEMNVDKSEDEQAKVISLPPLLLDLCIAMMGRFSPAFIRNFLIVTQRGAVIELLTTSQFPALQKRAYRLIEDSLEIVVVLNNSNNNVTPAEEAGRLSPEEQFKFVRNDIQPLLAEVLAKTSAPARRARLTCLLSFAKAALLTTNNTDNNAFYSTLLWEAIASLVDVNARARMVAIKLLVFISSAMVSPAAALDMCSTEKSGDKKRKSSTEKSVSEDDENATCRVESLLRLLLDRLPTASQWSSNQYQSAVEGCCAILIAVGRIFRQFRNPLIHEHITLVLDRIEPLLANSHHSTFRRVVRCVLTIISSAISALPGSELECLVSRLVPIISGSTFPETHRKPLRTTFERLLSKLARKCGLQKVASLLSDLRQNERRSDDKRLRHLFRTLNRACGTLSKGRSEDKSEAASDNDDVDEETSEGDEGAAERTSLARAKRERTKMTASNMDLVENVDDIADASAPGSGLRLAAKQHGLITTKMLPKSERSLKAGKIVVKKPRMSNDFDDEDQEKPDGQFGGSDDDYRNSDDDESDAEEKRHLAGRKRSKPIKKPMKKKPVIGSSSKKGNKKTVPAAKKGQKVQPFSYKPFQRQLLNKRRSVQFRDKRHK